MMQEAVHRRRIIPPVRNHCSPKMLRLTNRLKRLHRKIQARVDAITSASLNRRTDNTEGNLQVMAQAAAEATGGDLFSIIVTEPYNPEYNSMAGAAQADQRNGKEFAFVNEIENLEQYDTVYIGIPVWWGKLPQPMVSL